MSNCLSCGWDAPFLGFSNTTRLSKVELTLSRRVKVSMVSLICLSTESSSIVSALLRDWMSLEISGSN